MQTKQITLAAMLGAIITVQQVLLASIPNVSFTGFLIILFALTLDRKTNFFMIWTYLISRNLAFGSPIHIWILYITVFGGTSFFVSWFKGTLNNVWWASFIAFMLGPILSFVSAYTWMWFGGMNDTEILSYLIAGIPFMMIHSISNLVIMTSLFLPAQEAFESMLKKYYFIKGDSMNDT